MAIKAKKTPSSAKVTYSTTDAAVASVYDGTITANILHIKLKSHQKFHMVHTIMDFQQNILQELRKAVHQK